MTWSDIGVLAELLGAIGVIASLIYLSRQVRQNTRAVRMANAAAGQNNFQQLARFLYEDMEGCALILRAMEGADDLAPAERLSAYAYFFDFLGQGPGVSFRTSAESDSTDNGSLTSNLWTLRI
jgi:hypothetical protein